MQELYLPIISDPYYMKSTWYQEIIAGIKGGAASLRVPQPVRIFSEPLTEEGLASLPPVVILTNGSKAYVQSSVNALLSAGKHIVLSGLDSEPFGELISCATSSRRTDMARLVKYLISHGRKRIALVGFWNESLNDMLYYHSAISAATQYGAPIGKHAVFFWKECLGESLNAFIQHTSLFDAAICPNDTVALCLINYCRTRNIRVPQDLFLTGISNMHIGRYCDPSLTTIAMDFKGVGVETFNVWHYVYEHLPKPSSIKILVPGNLIIRASTDFAEEVPFSDAIDIQNSVLDEYPDNQFFIDPLITSLLRVEKCLHQRDEIDQKILIGIMQGKSYEKLAEELFLSTSTVRYHRNKIFKDADVNTRAAFEHLMRENIGNIGSHIID